MPAAFSGEVGGIVTFRIDSIPLLRLFFNAKENADRAWSLDFGPGSVEIQCAYVTIATNVEGYTKLDPPAVPSGWIYFREVTLEVADNAAVISRGLM